MNRRYAVIVRRTLVVVGLLCIPSFHTYIFHSLLGHPGNAYHTGLGHAIAYFAWGVSSYFAPLGVWLVVRRGLFKNAAGWLRACGYLVLACYGYMCFFTLQDFLVGNIPALHVPGTKLYDYGGAFMASLQTLTIACVFWPLLYVFQRRLAEQPLAAFERPRPTIRFLLGWIALASALLVEVRLVAEYGMPTRNGLHREPATDALNDYAAHLPLHFVDGLSIALMMIAFSGKPKQWLWAVPLASLFRLGAETFLMWMSGGLGYPNRFGVIAGPMEDRLPFLTGRVFISIAAFGVASATGMKFLPIGTSPPDLTCRPAA